MRLFGFLLIISFSGTAQDLYQSINDIEPVVLYEHGDTLFQYWELEGHDRFFNYKEGEIPALIAYRDTVKRNLGRKFDKFYNREIKQTDSSTLGRPPALNNWDLVHQGFVGSIDEMNWIEAQLLNYQLNRFPHFSNPTEFHGFIALNDSTGGLRIYFGASGDEFPPKPKWIIDHLEASLSEGWYLEFHLHNHFREKKEKYIGALAASKPDAQYFKALIKRFGMREAHITNGFKTVIIQAEEIYGLNSD